MHGHLVFRACDRNGVVSGETAILRCYFRTITQQTRRVKMCRVQPCGPHVIASARHDMDECRLSALESGLSVDSTGQPDYAQRRLATVLLYLVRQRGLAGVRERQGSASRVRAGRGVLVCLATCELT